MCFLTPVGLEVFALCFLVCARFIFQVFFIEIFVLNKTASSVCVNNFIDFFWKRLEKGIRKIRVHQRLLNSIVVFILGCLH